MQHYTGLLTVFFAAFFPTQLVAQTQGDALPLRFARERRIIVVEGTVNYSTRVNMMLDTGATCSVVSTRLAKALRLRTLLNRAAFNSNDRLIHRPIVVVPSIQLGPIQRPLLCFMAELPVEKVDLVIGRDALGKDTFTVDYERQLVQFGSAAPLAHAIPFDPSIREIIVPMQMADHEVLLKVDSGADALYILENKAQAWLRINPDLLSVRMGHISTERKGMKTRLKDVRLAGIGLGAVNAIILESLPDGMSHPVQWHGLLGLATLKAKRIQFDFKQGLFSWEP